MTKFIAYAYPGWHRSDFRPNVDEWALLDNFVPLFAGHDPLAEPLAGRYDDTDLVTAERQISDALAYGINGFTYFMFHTGTRFVLQQPVQAALRAATPTPFGVAATWCLRLPHQFLPIPQAYDQKGLSVAGAALGEAKADWGRFGGWTIQRLEDTFGAEAVASTSLAAIGPLLDSRQVGEVENVAGVAMQRTYRLNSDSLGRVFDAWIADLASHDNYIKFDRRPVLSVLNLPDFARVYGYEAFRLILALARQRVSSVLGVDPYLIGLVAAVDKANLALARRLPLDAVTGYGLLPEWDGPPAQQYDALVDRRVREWYRAQRELDVPFFPVVCSGWDATVRGCRVTDLQAVRGFPWRPVVVGATPELFGDFLDAAVDFNRHSRHDDVVFLHAWNEWTEGSAIEPNTRFGRQLVECVRARSRGSGQLS